MFLPPLPHGFQRTYCEHTKNPASICKNSLLMAVQEEDLLNNFKGNK